MLLSSLNVVHSFSIFRFFPILLNHKLNNTNTKVTYEYSSVRRCFINEGHTLLNFQLGVSLHAPFLSRMTHNRTLIARVSSLLHIWYDVHFSILTDYILTSVRLISPFTIIFPILWVTFSSTSIFLMFTFLYFLMVTPYRFVFNNPFPLHLYSFDSFA